VTQGREILRKEKGNGTGKVHYVAHRWAVVGWIASRIVSTERRLTHKPKSDKVPVLNRAKLTLMAVIKLKIVGNLAVPVIQVLDL